MPSHTTSASASTGEPPPTNGEQQHSDPATTASLSSTSQPAAAATFTALASSAATRVMNVYNTYPVTRYEKLNKIGEGTYGTVCQTGTAHTEDGPHLSHHSLHSDHYRLVAAALACSAADRAKDKVTGEIVALKKIRMMKEKAGVSRAARLSLSLRVQPAAPQCWHRGHSFDLTVLFVAMLQFPLTSIREIKLLQALRHPHLVSLHCIAVGRRPDSIFLVFEFCTHDMGSLIDQHNALSHPHSSHAASAPPLFTEGQIKRLVLQLLSGVEYMHAHFTMHRDLKLSNLLLSASGQVKIADMGLARVFSNPLDQYTPKVVTLWYRAPELLLGSSSSYHSAIDIWSAITHSCRDSEPPA